MSLTVTVRRNGIPALAVQITTRSRRNVDDTAIAIRDRAQQLAPVDTGSLRESLYVGNGTDSDYAQRAGAARSRNPEAVIVPEVTPEFAISLSGGSSGYSAVVGSAVEHAIFQEFGTRFQGPQSFLIPALEVARGPYVALMSTVADT